MTRALSAVWRHQEGLCHRWSAEVLIVLAPGGAEPIVLHGAAALVFDRLRVPTSGLDVVASIQSETGEDPAEVEAGVLEALAMLGAADLVASDG